MFLICLHWFCYEAPGWLTQITGSFYFSDTLQTSVNATFGFLPSALEPVYGICSSLGGWRWKGLRCDKQHMIVQHMAATESERSTAANTQHSETKAGD